MATVTVTKSASNSVKGRNWTAYDARKRNCTIIFDELWYKITGNKELSFEDLVELIKETYETTDTKSRCGIYSTESYLDICRPNKTMPDIWIINEELEICSVDSTMMRDTDGKSTERQFILIIQ